MNRCQKLIESVKPLSSEFLESRGKCCSSGCINCPYFPKHSGSKLLKKDVMKCAIPCDMNTIENKLCECLNE